MKNKRYSDAQVMGILKQAESGMNRPCDAGSSISWPSWTGTRAKFRHGASRWMEKVVSSITSSSNGFGDL